MYLQMWDCAVNHPRAKSTREMSRFLLTPPLKGGKLYGGQSISLLRS